MINKIIRNFLAKQIAGRSDDGIMITLRDPQKVELLENIMADLLMRNGIDPKAITSEAQLKTILNQIEAMTKQSTTSGIRNTKSAKVFDLEGQEIKNTDNIMGGKELKFDDDLPPPGSRGGKDDIAAPIQSSEESLRDMMIAENKKNINKIKQRQKMLNEAIDDASPGFSGDRKVDAELVAENLAERMGLVYDDLPTKQRLDLYDQAYTGLSKKRPVRRESLEDFVDDAGGVDPDDPRGIDDFIPDDDPEPLAKGGRVGLKGGADASQYDKSPSEQKSVDISPSGSVTLGSGPPEGPDDRASADQDMIQMLVRQGYTPEEINAITNPTVIDKVKQSRLNNPVTRGILRTGAYLYNPTLAGIDFRRAMQLKNLYDYTMNQINNPNITEEDMQFAKGGIARIGLKDGMNRRTFLKLLGGAMSIPIIGKIFKPLKVGKTVTKVPIIKTDNVPGKPEWFDQLVNKVILEGDEVTKRFATKDREIVHMKVLDEGTGGKEFPPGTPGSDDISIMVTQDLDAGAVRVEYRNPENMYGDPVQLRYKKPNPDEGDPRPSAEFDTAESIPVARADGPDDYAIDIDEGGGQSIKDLTSDVSKLKEYATGQKQTLKEFVQSKKRKDKARAISQGEGEAEQDFIINRQGEEIVEYPEPDFDDAFASGGIARMLGE